MAEARNQVSEQASETEPEPRDSALSINDHQSLERTILSPSTEPFVFSPPAIFDDPTHQHELIDSSIPRCDASYSNGLLVQACNGTNEKPYAHTTILEASVPTPYHYICPQDLILGAGECDSILHDTVIPPVLNVKPFLSTSPFIRSEDGSVLNIKLSAPLQSHSPVPLRNGSIHTSTQRNAERIAPIKAWLAKHTLSPYPTEEELSCLSDSTGLTIRQVRTCLNNQRSRSKCRAQDSPNDFAASPTFEVCRQHSAPLHSPKANGGHDEFHEEFFDTLLECNGLTYESTLINLQHSNSDIEATNPSLPTELTNDFHVANETPTFKRKGKRQHGSRFQPTGIATPAFANPTMSNYAQQGRLAPYHCTVCPKAFKTSYEWKRHESAVHGFYVKEWVCMLTGSPAVGTPCPFCSSIISDTAHYDKHNISRCHGSDLSIRTFGRKDLLKQHIQQIHLNDVDRSIWKAVKVPESWAQDVHADRCSPQFLWCGFCCVEFSSPTERIEHVAAHFRDGKSIEEWLRKPE